MDNLGVKAETWLVLFIVEVSDERLTVTGFDV